MPRRMHHARARGKRIHRRASVRAAVLTWSAAMGLGVGGAAAQTVRWHPVEATGAYSISTDHIIVPPGVSSVTFELILSDWGQAMGSPRLSVYQATVDSGGYFNGIGDPLVPFGWPDSPEMGAFIAQQVCSNTGDPCGPNGTCGPSAGACVANPEFVFTEFVPLTLISTATLNYQWGANAAGGCKADDGRIYYGGTLVLDVPDGAGGTYAIAFDSGEDDTFFNDCSGTRISGLTTVPALLTVLTDAECLIGGPSSLCPADCDNNAICDLCDIAYGALDDCNGNSVPDVCDLSDGTSYDCDSNGVPDECEADCNNNGVHDDCDVAEGSSADCNGNDVPDECEPDCQPNGTADECDLLFGFSDDCNSNDVPDECEPDCQPNGLADGCDLLFGLSTDCDGNETPDECDEDCDGNGVPDTCETPTAPQIAWKPRRATGPFAFCGNEVVVAPSTDLIELELALSGWGLAAGSPLLGTYQGALDTPRLAGGHPDNLANGTTAGLDLQPLTGVHGAADGAFITLRTCASPIDLSSTGQRCDVLTPPLPPCPPEALCLSNPEFVFSGTVQTVGVSTTQYIWGAVTSPGLCRLDEGGKDYYGGTLILQVPAGATGIYTLGFISDPSSTFLNDCAGNGIAGVDLRTVQIRFARCGDGLIEFEEQCDDANAENRDGCSEFCMVEETWHCIGTPSVCTTRCGNEINDPGETCDDGNLADGDGCSSVCQVEAQCELAALSGSGGAANDLFGSGASISGDYAIVGSPRFDGTGNNTGRAYVFVDGPVGWSQQASLTGSALPANANFGAAVALHSNLAVVGSPGGGATYVFQRSGNAWVQQGRLFPPDFAADAEFGAAVAVDTDFVVVGTPRDDDVCPLDPDCDSGAVHVFRFGAQGWTHAAKLTASDAEAGELFGTAVSINGSRIAVGAHWDNKRGSRSGSVYFYRFDGLSWVEELNVTPADGAANDQFGRAVALNGERAVISAWFDDDGGSNSGAAYVFKYEGSGWSEEAKLVAADARQDDNFGSSVAIDEQLVLVGASGKDDACGGASTCNSGSAYVFRRDPAGWTQSALVNASNAAAGDRFGWSVALHNGRAVVGARDADVAGDENRGAAYMFAVGGDCNQNTIPDVCDLAAGLRPDCNENEVPDDCDPDGDDDAVPDDCDVCPGGNDALDGDSDGVADFCDPCPADNPDDTDGDGVCESNDTCSGFDDLVDGDEDGVPDGCDVCAGGDDAADGDGDGVADFCDPCPADNPDDTDRDGVCESDDACPGFDDATDGDEDGVPDGCDVCPGGNDALDGDSDGVADFCDRCPADNPDDTDGDGACDSEDRCPGHNDAEDCDNDEVPDGCEPDCQPNGAPDICEILAGNSMDANGNGVPDECEPGSCCHDDGTCTHVLESDCPVGGWSLDGACEPNPCAPPGACCSAERTCAMVVEADCTTGTWSADETCEFNPCLQSPLQAAYPHDRMKNRYISFDPNPSNAGVATAIRVDLLSLEMGSCSGNGAPCRVERGRADCGRCSASGDPCINTAIDCNPNTQSCEPTGQVCVNDQSGSIGRSWWVGPVSPAADGVHLLVSAAFRELREEWASVVHVGDCEIVPAASYGVRIVDVEHGFESDALVVSTIQRPAGVYWADAVGALSYFCGGDSRADSCDPHGEPCGEGEDCLPAWPPPDGVVDFDDILAAVFAFENQQYRTLPDITWVDMQGAGRGDSRFDPPDHVPNLADVQFMVLAFAGLPYPFADPAVCPDVAAWP